MPKKKKSYPLRHIGDGPSWDVIGGKLLDASSACRECMDLLQETRDAIARAKSHPNPTEQAILECEIILRVLRPELSKAMRIAFSAEYS
jgi:hypothetical protein